MRKDGWEQRLENLIDSARRKPYEVGVHDCFLFCCDAIEAITGERNQAADEARGKYTSVEMAVALFKEYGSLRQAGSVIFGSRPVLPSLLRRGDIALYKDDDGMHHLGVCVGAKFVLLASDGIVMVKMDKARCGWRVG